MYTKQERMPKNKKNESFFQTAFLGAMIALLGGFLLSYNYIQKQKIMAYDYMSNTFYDGEKVAIRKNTEAKNTSTEQVNSQTQNTENVTQADNSYIGYLNIPKINLTKGFVDINSADNTVEKNIMVVEGSDYPNVDKGNFIIAGHSGTGWKAFFNDLRKLTEGDTAKVTYKGVTYTYQIVNIYTQPKTGKLAIYRNYDKTTLTLITCTNNDSTTQTIYIAELINKEE